MAVSGSGSRSAITDRVKDYADGIYKKLFDLGIRVEEDARSEKLGYKIREAQLQKIPYMIVVGDKEAEAGLVAVRTRGGEDLGTITIDEFIGKIQREIKERA